MTDMDKALPLVAALLIATAVKAQDIIVHDELVKSFKVEVNDDWSLPPVLMMGSDDAMTVSFDRLGHDYSGMNYRITHCNWDWTPSDMNEIDYLDGFNDNDIEDYAPSVNTTVEYTHYRFTIPNDKVGLRLSGNYLVEIRDDDDNPVAEARFRVLEQEVSVGTSISPNTLIDANKTHQQVDVIINYGGYTIRIPQNEVKVVVMQNSDPNTAVVMTQPSYVGGGKLEYANDKALIFDAGNEFRRFEMLNENDVMMGLSSIKYYAPYYHATLDIDKPRRNYNYDEDQDGKYIIRNNNVYDSSTEADYMLVHFTLNADELYDTDVYVYGCLTGNEMGNDCRMSYNSELGCYEKTLLLKQGLYNYRYVTRDNSGRPVTADIEGNFYETENEYSVYVYHRAFGERYDKLIGFSHARSR